MSRVIILLLISLVIVPIVAACDPTISITITRPYGSEAEPIVIAAKATSGCPVTTMRVYADSKLLYEQHNQNYIDGRFVMGAGSHKVSVNAWNSAGTVAHAESYIVSTADPYEPPAGCDITGAGIYYGGDHIPYATKSPVRVGMVAASDSAAISSMRLYIDGVDRAQVWGTSGYCLPVALFSLKPGYHFINLQGWDALGHILLTGSILQVIQ